MLHNFPKKLTQKSIKFTFVYIINCKLGKKHIFPRKLTRTVLNFLPRLLKMSRFIYLTILRPTYLNRSWFRSSDFRTQYGTFSALRSSRGEPLASLEQMDLKLWWSKDRFIWALKLEHYYLKVAKKVYNRRKQQNICSNVSWLLVCRCYNIYTAICFCS